MKKIIIILAMLVLLLNACSQTDIYAGKHISYTDPIGFKFNCGKTPSQKSWSFNPPSITANLEIPDTFTNDLLKKLLEQNKEMTKGLLSIKPNGDKRLEAIKELAEVTEKLVSFMDEQPKNIDKAIKKCNKFLQQEKD